ncbi:thioredoxin family protein [Methanoregula sp.]|uniref:thioredoxin family protein n=1 Tax=Methanoregula sp. TaxID=2052170 RepID=UPI002BC36707|nr:thioredoxin family protein [Methanoregula sp.]HVP95770.1 thioredoxin family protein [Methanoregula sp.]
MDRIIKFVVALFVIIAAASVASLVFAAQGTTPAATPSVANDSIVYYFYGQGCPHCAAIEPFMENMTKKYPDVDIRMLEVWYNQTNQQTYTQVNAAAGISSPQGVPEVVIGKTVLIGQLEIPDKLEGYLRAIEKKK